MSKVIRVHRFGGPEVLQLEDLEIGAPKAGEVLIEQRAVGLNYIDIYQRKGLYPNPLPFTPGSEAAGDVIAVGPGVEEFKPGDRVAYGTSLGAYAERRLVEARHLVPLPADVSYEIGAVMMLKGLTAQYLLRRTHRVGPQDTILVHAAAGGVGLILCQWGKALGARVIGTAGSAEKAQLAKAHGADEVILYREADFVSEVKRLTQGELCTVVYDGVGKDTFPGSLDCLRPLGLFCSYGSSSGPIEAFNIGLLAQKGSLFATRPTLFTYAGKRQDLLDMTADLLGAMRSGAVTLDVRARFPLAEAAQAHQSLEARSTAGSTVLLP